MFGFANVTHQFPLTSPLLAISPPGAELDRPRAELDRDSRSPCPCENRHLPPVLDDLVFDIAGTRQSNFSWACSSNFGYISFLARDVAMSVNKFSEGVDLRRYLV